MRRLPVRGAEDSAAGRGGGRPPATARLACGSLDVAATVAAVAGQPAGGPAPSSHPAPVPEPGTRRARPCHGPNGSPHAAGNSGPRGHATAVVAVGRTSSFASPGDRSAAVRGRVAGVAEVRVSAGGWRLGGGPRWFRASVPTRISVCYVLGPAT